MFWPRSYATMTETQPSWRSSVPTWQISLQWMTGFQTSSPSRIQNTTGSICCTATRSIVSRSSASSGAQDRRHLFMTTRSGAWSVCFVVRSILNHSRSILSTVPFRWVCRPGWIPATSNHCHQRPETSTACGTPILTKHRSAYMSTAATLGVSTGMSSRQTPQP